MWYSFESSYLNPDSLSDEVWIYFLTNFGIDINMVDDNGNTFLHQLIILAKEYFEMDTGENYSDKMAQMLKVLISCGIDLNTNNKFGLTAQELLPNDELYRNLLFGTQANLLM